MQRKKKILLGFGIAAGVLLCIYLGVSIYFKYHFYDHTTINGINLSLKTANDAEAAFKKKIDGYTLTIQPKEGEKEEIKGKEISMVYVKSDTLKKALKKQNPFLWPSMFRREQNIRVEMDFEYDAEELNSRIQALECFSNEGKTDPKDAKPEFDGQKYIAGNVEFGTKVDQTAMLEKLKAAVDDFQTEFDLLEEDCYQKPKYTSDSKELLEACDKLNAYCKASITYNMTPYTEVVDAALISSWLSCDENLNVSLQEEKVREYMDQFAQKYETVGKTRPLTTPTGKETEVSGGTYGWAFDEAAEAEALIASIKAGEVTSKEPAYEQKAASHEPQDWGTTFIEVDLTTQHMWYIADGNVAFESDVVTGQPYYHSTPSGVYDILNMAQGATLVGNIDPETNEPEYRTPVAYWMPVTWGGVGFHDATWQPYFGGDLYLYNGSHGCINMPLDGAAALYSLISVGTPVVMHY